MCGICGIYNFVDKKPVIPEELINMRDVMYHRGPDDEGIFIKNHIGLGHRRLSIIDLNYGHQPMASDDGLVWIVYNGEVYNYIELKNVLEKKGYRFRTSSDTEVIIKMYEEYEESCLYYLNGMFAFAILDLRKEKLFLTRDHLGIKPLYYSLTSHGLVFASEIKSLLQNKDAKKEIKPESIDSYMTFGYVIAPETMFKDIKKLCPGHFMICMNSKITIKRYWDLSFKHNIVKNNKHYEERLISLLEDSVRLQLRSDVPIGVLLSGGVDSSAIVALLSKNRMMSDQIKTFTMSYQRGFNEKSYAKLVADKFHTEHYEITITSNQFKEFIPYSLWYMDEPISDATLISLYYVSLLSSRYVKVVLSGEGPDEFLGGYRIYQIMKLIEYYQKIPLIPARSFFPILLKGIFKENKFQKYYELSLKPIEKRYPGVNFCEIGEKNKVLEKDFLASLKDWDPLSILEPLYERTKGEDFINRMLYIDINTWLPDNTLLKADRMSMATSIELRVPFLDYTLVEFMASIPSSLKIKGKAGKYILKRSLMGIVPRKVLAREKVGFPTPISILLKEDLKDYMREILMEPHLLETGYFDKYNIMQLINEHIDGKLDHSRILWRLLVLSVWFRNIRVIENMRLGERISCSKGGDYTAWLS